MFAAGDATSQVLNKNMSLTLPGQNPLLLTSHLGRDKLKPQVALSITIPEPDESFDVDTYPAAVRVRNTFIDVGQPSSVERFNSDRIVRSCPGSQVGFLEDAFKEPAGEGVQHKCILQLAEMLEAPVPCDFAQAAPDRHAAENVTLQEPRQSAHIVNVPAPPAPPAASGLHMVRCPPPPPPPPWQNTRTPLSSRATLFTPGTLQQGGFEDFPQQQQLCPAVAELMNFAQAAGSNASWVSQISHHSADFVSEMHVVQQSSAETSSGSEDLPSVGSVGHNFGECKPCAFFHTKGCEYGASCSFCHLCGSGEKKRRQKEKKQAFRSNATAA